MTDEKQRVIDIIRNAFKGVELGNGVGLQEGNGLDDYADEPTRKAYRDQDEKSNWEAIPAQNLNQYYCSLSYFDPEGMRFHLPAFLIADIRGLYRFNLIYPVAERPEYDSSVFSLLSPTQRTAVREYLLLIKNDPTHRIHLPQIERSLETYWTFN